jgi:hypothetical protein
MEGSNALLLIVTVTRPDGGMEQDASLARLAHTLRHVEPPLLWIVVGAENRTATARAVRVLRGTGLMFRHLTYDASNLTFADADANYQRNVALRHIEQHRLNGVVHFAGASVVYDLRFFQELRRTLYAASFLVFQICNLYLLFFFCRNTQSSIKQVNPCTLIEKMQRNKHLLCMMQRLRSMTVATVSPADQRVTIDGPKCNSSQFTGFRHYRD